MEEIIQTDNRHSFTSSSETTGTGIFMEPACYAVPVPTFCEKAAFVLSFMFPFLTIKLQTSFIFMSLSNVYCL